jgi:hypothetical protein
VRRTRHQPPAVSSARWTTVRSTPSNKGSATDSVKDADPVYVAALAASTGAIVTRMTRVLVTQMPDVDPEDPAVIRCHHAYIRQAFDLLFSGFDESGAVRPDSASASPGMTAAGSRATTEEN